MIINYFKSTYGKQIVVSLILLIVFSENVMSQKNGIEGVIRDAEDNSTLIGATIREHGTSNATTTDIDGKFSMALKSDTSTLIISYVGYTPKLINIDGKKMGGKTGTSQVRNISKKERESGVLTNEQLKWHMRNHGLFVGYAPTDKPKYAVCVITEHAGGSGPAAKTTAKVMSELLKYGK